MNLRGGGVLETNNNQSWLGGRLNYQYLDPNAKKARAVGYHPDGKLSFKYYLNDGKLDGLCKAWHENGQLNKISSYSRFPQGNRAPFYYNNFLHSISNYYLSFHSPCSFNCQKTKVYNKKNMEPFDAQDVFMLQGLAASAAVALENAYALEERKKIEEELRQEHDKEQKYLDTAAVMPVGIGVA